MLDGPCLGRGCRSHWVDMWLLFDSLRRMKLSRAGFPVLMVGEVGVPRLSCSRLVYACWAGQGQVLVAF